MHDVHTLTGESCIGDGRTKRTVSMLDVSCPTLTRATASGCSFRILLWPVLSRILRHRARRRGTRRGAAAVTPVMTTHHASLLGSHRLIFRWWMESRRRCRRACGGGRAVRHLATDAEDADCGASSGDRACRSSSQAWREGMRSSRQAWAKCTGSDGDARGGEWQHQTAALSCTCRTWHWCSKGFASGNGAKRRTSR